MAAALESPGAPVYHEGAGDEETVNQHVDGQDSCAPDGVPIMTALDGIRLARSSSRAIPRGASLRVGAAPAGIVSIHPCAAAGTAVPKPDPPPRYAYESDDDLLGPEEFGPIVFRDGIFQIDDISSETKGGLDPKLKRLIDSILDPGAGEAGP